MFYVDCSLVAPGDFNGGGAEWLAEELPGEAEGHLDQQV